MKVSRLLLILAVVLFVTVAWLRWNYPRQVDMAGYVPAESLLYLEVNDLPKIATSMAHTDAWKILSTRSELQSGLFGVTWMSRLARWTGIGTGEEVILARSQFALVVMGLDATDDQPTLRIRPVAALVIETHTSERRMRPAIEKRIEQFARRVYPQSSVIRKTIDGIEFVEWVSPQDGRSIVATFLDSVAIVGNSELAVQACSAVRRGTRTSLAGNKDLAVMRARLRDNRTAAFGYVSSNGLGKFLASAAPIYVDRISTSPEAQRILAGLAGKLLQSAGWAASFAGGGVEDRYFLSLPPDVASALREAFTTPPTRTANAIRFLPADTYSFTQYNLRDPRLAWRGLNRTLSSHVDILGAVLVTPLLKAALAPYGIDDPDAFLGAVGPQIVTARLDEGETASVLIVQTQDERILQKLVAERLGANARKERVADSEMLVSSDEDSLAAAFVEQQLLIGPAEFVRRCLLARSQQSTLDAVNSYKLASPFVSSVHPIAVTYSRDVLSAQEFLSLISGSKTQSMKGDSKLSEIPYAVAVTALGEDGFEKTTRSAFGLFATLAAQIASDVPVK